MAEHFLLTKAARDLPVAQVLRMPEAKAYAWFRRARWPETDGKPYCPHCGILNCYELTRRRFKCSDCRKEFSVTSGTIFASRKLSFRQIVGAIALAASSVKGKAALHLTRELGVSYKTAYVLLMKLREAVASERAHLRLTGTVEIDGMYIGGHVRPKNRKEERVDRRRREHQSPDRQCLMALRQRNGRIVTVVCQGQEENSDVAWDLVKRYVEGDAQIAADEHKAYDDLHGLFPLVRVNHSEAYVGENGESTNQVESFFSRVRRAARGVHHRIPGRYMDWYPAELALREDMRRKGNGLAGGRAPAEGAGASRLAEHGRILAGQQAAVPDLDGARRRSD